MMNVVLKTIFSLSILAFISIVFFMGELPLVEGYNLFDPYADTRFYGNYTPKKFESIYIGMHKKKVIELLGEPTHRAYSDSLQSEYEYSGDGKLYDLAVSRGAERYGDFAWYMSSVKFSCDSAVIQINKGWIYD